MSTWRVGHAIDPQPEDKTYDNEREAIERAAHRADCYGFNVPIAVWNDRDEIEHLYLCGQRFKSA